MFCVWLLERSCDARSLALLGAPGDLRRLLGRRNRAALGLHQASSVMAVPVVVLALGWAMWDVLHGRPKRGFAVFYCGCVVAFVVFGVS